MAIKRRYRRVRAAPRNSRSHHRTLATAILSSQRLRRAPGASPDLQRLTRIDQMRPAKVSPWSELHGNLAA